MHNFLCNYDFMKGILSESNTTRASISNLSAYSLLTQFFIQLRKY
jgi:hypothetical protein